MNDLDMEEREVLTLARAGLAPGRADKERVRQAVFASIANAVPDGTPNVTTRAARHKRVAASLVLAAGTGLLGYVLGLVAGRSDTALPILPRIPAADAFVVRLNPPTDLPDDTVAHDLAGAKPALVLHDAKASGANAASVLNDEVETLRKVNRALREQRPRDALALLNALDQRLPGGRLMEERAASRTLAECDLCPAATARPLAAQFSKRYPGSVYEPRVTRGCGSLPAPRTDSPDPGDTRSKEDSR
jgi:hypothetical protein